MENNYVILSNGAYSNYDPIYFCGGELLSQDELDTKGREVGDIVSDIFNNLPVRKHENEKYHEVCYSTCEKYEKYWPLTNEAAYSSDLSNLWFKEMETWLVSIGYKRIPKNIPEINVSYSEIPISKDI